MLELKIKTVSEYLSIIEKLYKDAPAFFGKTPLKVLFRGQENLEWPLLPGLFRYESFYHNEIDLIKELERKLPQEFNQKNILEKLIKMQHYGAPTRLLDLTGNPLVGLYFACSQKMESDGVVYVENGPLFSIDSPGIQAIERMMYNKQWFDEQYDEKLKDEHTVAIIKSPINNQRLHNQDGYFALYNYHGKYKKFDWSPLDIDGGFLLAKIIIPSEEKSALVKELSLLGIKKSFLFPELQYEVESVIDDLVYS